VPHCQELRDRGAKVAWSPATQQCAYQTQPHDELREKSARYVCCLRQMSTNPDVAIFRQFGGVRPRRSKGFQRRLHDTGPLRLDPEDSCW
jgi:hypothetical protein